VIGACPQCRATPCAACERVARLDAMARAEMVLDAETAIAEPDLDPQPWELNYEPPAQNDDGDDIAAALDARGYHNTARALRESTGGDRAEAIATIRHALPALATEAA
jgi:hypothetical protein